MKSFLLFTFILISNVLISQKNIENSIEKIHRIYTPKKALEKLDSIYSKVNLLPRTRVLINHKRLQYCMTTSDYKRVTEISIETIEFAKKHKLDSLTPYPYMMIGCSQYMNNRIEDALESFKNSLKLAEKYKNYNLIAANCNNIGGLLIDKKKYKEGEKYLLKSINYSINNKDVGSKILSSRILATSYEWQGKLKDAAKIYEELEIESKKIKDPYVLSSLYNYHGELLKKLGRKKEALEKIKTAKSLLYQIGDTTSVVASLKYEANFYRDNKAFKDEAITLRELITLTEKYNKNKNQKQVNLLETKFRTNEIKQEKLIAQSKMLVEKSKKNNYLILLISFIIIAIGLYFIIHLRSIRKSTQLKLQIQEQRLASLIEGQENERTRIAKELHDGIVQDLTVLKLNLSENSDLSIIESGLTKITKELRELSYQMMPITLKELGLIPALEDLFNRSFTQKGIAYHFETYVTNERLDGKIEVNIYRICQELINNTLKHANASEVNIVFRKKNDELTLIFEDNGKGFDVSNFKSGIGLSSLRERLEAIHGKIEFDSTISEGTTAFIRIQLVN